MRKVITVTDVTVSGEKTHGSSVLSNKDVSGTEDLWPAKKKTFKKSSKMFF